MSQYIKQHVEDCMTTSGTEIRFAGRPSNLQLVGVLIGFRSYQR